MVVLSTTVDEVKNGLSVLFFNILAILINFYLLSESHYMLQKMCLTAFIHLTAWLLKKVYNYSDKSWWEDMMCDIRSFKVHLQKVRKNTMTLYVCLFIYFIYLKCVQ